MDVQFPARHSLVQKAGLVADVLSSYVFTQWWLRRRGLPGAIAQARGGGHECFAEVPGAYEYGLRLGRVVRRVLTPLPADTRCLARALVLIRLLARREVPAVLVIGVASDPVFNAHAWVEHDGRPLLPAGEGRFQRLTQL